MDIEDLADKMGMFRVYHCEGGCYFRDSFESLREEDEEDCGDEKDLSKPMSSNQVRIQLLRIEKRMLQKELAEIELSENEQKEIQTLEADIKILKQKLSSL